MTTDLKKRQSIKNAIAITLGITSGIAGGMLTSGLGAGGGGGGAVSIQNLPNGTLLLDKYTETVQVVFFSITEQFFDFTTTTSFNSGEELMVTADFEFSGDTNALGEFIVRFLVEGVQLGSAETYRLPATGAGDTFLIGFGHMSRIRTLTSSGTKTFRIGVDSDTAGNAALTITNRRIYRRKNASS